MIIEVQQGDEGEAVKGVQYELFFERNDARKDMSQVDGIFGPITDEAVRDFQKHTELAVDGIVGPITWEKLVGGALII